MTAEQIQSRAGVERLKFETAAQIRALLDTARKAADDAGQDGEEFEGAILELVTEEA